MPRRHQRSTDQKQVSMANGLRCGPSRVRPEFGPECDIRNILRRVNGDTRLLPPATRQGADFDFDTDLLQVQQSTLAARAAFNELPEKVRREYGSWRNVLAALQAGELKLKPRPQAPGHLVPKAEAPPAGDKAAAGKPESAPAPKPPEGGR